MTDAAPGLELAGIELWQWRKQAQAQAIAAQIPIAEIDWLLREAGLDSLSLRLELFKQQPQIKLERSLSELNQLWQRRIQQQVPVQYLVGKTVWRQFSLQVSPAVLIPRPETELLIDLAKSAAPQTGEIQPGLQSGNWADLGTGSGAIAIGLADAFPAATIHAVDRSEAALKVAQKNAQQLGLSDRIHFYTGSWFEPLNHLKGQLAAMISNPPYIPTNLIQTLQPEVARHEPHSALDGGADGLNDIRHLIKTAPHYLRSNGFWLIEMMAGQAATVAELLHQQGDYQSIQIYPDLAGIARFALAYRR